MLLMTNSSRASPTPQFGSAWKSKARWGSRMFLVIFTGHIGHDDVAGLDAPHLRSVLYDAHDARADLVADGAARGEHLGLLFQEEALLPFRRFTGFHRFGPRLQDIYFSVSPVLRPLDIH